MEKYSKDIYSSIIKSITPWIPSFAKIDENEAFSYFDKQVRGTLIVAIEGIQSKIEKNIEEELSSKEQINIDILNTEIKKLKIDLAELKIENLRLNKLLSDSNSKQTSELIEPVNTSKDSVVKLEDDEVSVDSNVDINIPIITSNEVGESIVSESKEDYDNLSITELRKIAKDKKIKGYTKIESAEELIKLIKKAPPTLL